MAVSQALYIVAPSIWGMREETEATADGFWAIFRIKRSLVYENTMLHEEVARMQAQVLDRNLLEEKVLKLEEALGRVNGDNRVTADVLSFPGYSLYDILTIDAGTEHGIALGNQVVYAGAGIVGEIAEVYPSSAKVKLYSSPIEEYAVLVGNSMIPGVAHGRGMGNFEAKLPKGSLVFAGDTVVVPKGNLVLGVVASLEEEPALPFINVFFRTSFNIAEIRSVEVIIGKR
ncbi:MAG: rod shape-determining protein MreC [Candidatus Yonathbacteria bacterium]|nr:rod shape-determining protein MreC [Candidatus Yonathbacteria bacterium]